MEKEREEENRCSDRQATRQKRMRTKSERGGSEARKEQRGSPSEKEKERKERGREARQGCV